MRLTRILLSALCSASLLPSLTLVAQDMAPLSLTAANPNAAPSNGDTSAREEQSIAIDPQSGLTADLLYTVLVGQIAAQRDDQKTAFTHFLLGAQLARDAELAERAARAALKLGDAEEIQRAVDVWLDISPESMTAHQIAAYVRLQNDDVDGAMHHLRRLVNLASDEGENGFMQAARLVHKLRPPEKRLELMEYLTDGEPENADAWFARALVAAGVDRHADAADAARRATELRPGWSEPRIFLVQVLRDMGEQLKARETLERFVAENPKDSALRMLYAQLLVDDKEFAKAREVFGTMLEDDPKEAEVLFALGILSLQLDDMVAGREYFTRLRGTGERRDDAAYYLGQIEELDDNSDDAITWYDRVRGEHELDAKVRIARVEARRGGMDKAREMLRRLRDQWKEDAVLLYMLEAEMLSDLDRKHDAMDVYDAAIETFPDNAELLYSRALHAASMHQVGVLERDLSAILAVDPNHADALNAFGYTLADQTERFEEALAFIERALALKPDDPAVLDSMGWVQYRLGNLEEALRYLRRALDETQDGEIAAHLGEVLWALGERDAAWRVWEAALAEDPDHEYLLRVMGRHRFSKTDTGL